jgi:putative flippase GtrA
VSGRTAELVKFLVVGGCGYAANLLVFGILFDVGWPAVHASLVAYLGSNALMYFGNRYVTFRLSRSGFGRDYPRYLLVGVVVGGLNAALLLGLIERTGVDPGMGQAISLLALTPIAFVLVRRWAFRVRTT